MPAIVERAKWDVLVKMFQYLYYAKLRKEEIKKVDYLFKFGKHKQVAEKVWDCFFVQHLEWPHEMYNEVYK